MNELIYQSPNLKLNYFEGPDNGVPALLLHGSSSRWQSFMPVLAEMMNQSHVYALDLRGHGKSDHLPGAYRLQDHVKDISTFLTNIIKKPAVILGHSLGGMIAIMAAAYHPELVQAIIIADAPLTLNSLRNLVEKQKASANQLIDYLIAGKKDEIYNIFNDDDTAQSFCLSDPDAIAAIFDRFDDTFEKYQTEKLLPLIQCPVLVMRGDENKGSLITEYDMLNTLKLLPQLTQVQIPNAGHALFNDDKINVLKAIKSFLAK